MTDIFAVEVQAYNAGIVTLYYCTGVGFSTKPTDTPASTHFDARVAQALALTRWLYAADSTRGRSSIGYGDIVLLNGDSALDDLLKYGFDGRTITVRRGVLGAAYPSGFTTEFVGTMSVPEFQQTTFTIKLRDKQAEASIPFQPTKYTGAGLGTLEGTADDLKGKPKPICYGKVLNIAPPCVETAKLIYQVHDAAIASLDGVYDRGVALGANLFIAGGSANAGQCPTSPDGFTWTDGINTDTTRAVAFGGGVFVKGDNSANGGSSSTDGKVWTARNLQFGADTVLAITYGGGLFVAVGSNGKLSTSPDGATWTARTSGFGASSILGVAFGGGVYVAVGVAGKLYSSTDAITWTSRTSQFGATVVEDAAYSSTLSLFVAVGSSGKISTSADGTTWTSRTSGIATALHRVAFGAGVFVAVGDSAAIVVSADGTTWESAMSGYATTVVLQAVAYGNGAFVAVGDYGVISSSRDGFLWSPRAASGAAQQLLAVGFGSGLAQGTYANSTDLLDNALAPTRGNYKVYLAGGCFRLGATPDGLVTADVTEGAAAGDRTAGQIYKRILDDRMGKTAGDWSASDITTLDSAINYVLGLWVFAEQNFGAVFDAIAESVGGSWWVDKTGVFRITQLLAPTGTAVRTLTANDLLKPLEFVASSDLGQGLPSYQNIVKHSRNYSTQDVDLAGAVTDARRAFLALQWREAKATDAAVQTKNVLAPQIVEESLLTSESNAQSEATRRQTLRGVQRHLYKLVVAWTDENAVLDFNDVIELTHARYKLGASSLFRVLGITPDAKAHTLEFTVWGRGSGE